MIKCFSFFFTHGSVSIVRPGDKSIAASGRGLSPIYLLGRQVGDLRPLFDRADAVAEFPTVCVRVGKKGRKKARKKAFQIRQHLLATTAPGPFLDASPSAAPPLTVAATGYEHEGTGTLGGE